MDYSSFTAYVQSQRDSIVGKCTACGACLDHCPVFQSMQYFELGSERIMQSMVIALEENKPSPEAYETFYSCMGCEQCAPACPVGITPSLVMRMAGLEMVKQGWKAPESLYQINPDTQYNFAQVFDGLQMRPSSERWLPRAPENPNPVDVVLFVGCYPPGLPHIVFTLLDILEKMKINFVALGGNDLCCGAGRFFVGDVAGAGEGARELVENIMAFSPKHVVFECAGCYRRYKSTTPKFTEVPFQPEHISQFLYDNLDKIQFVHSIDKVVTYHDSCALGRHAGEYDAPRKLIQSIPGIRLVEMKHTMQDALCCGGLANFGHGDVTRKHRAVRFEEAVAAGAELLATTCAGCYTAYTGFDHKYPIEVVTDIELLGQAMGIEHPNKYREYVYSDSVSKIIEGSRDMIRDNGLDVEKMQTMLETYLTDARDK